MNVIRRVVTVIWDLFFYVVDTNSLSALFNFPVELIFGDHEFSIHWMWRSHPKRRTPRTLAKPNILITFNAWQFSALFIATMKVIKKIFCVCSQQCHFLASHFQFGHFWFVFLAFYAFERKQTLIEFESWGVLCLFNCIIFTEFSFIHLKIPIWNTIKSFEKHLAHSSLFSTLILKAQHLCHRTEHLLEINKNTQLRQGCFLSLQAKLPFFSCLPRPLDSQCK